MCNTLCAEMPLEGLSPKTASDCYRTEYSYAYSQLMLILSLISGILTRTMNSFQVSVAAEAIAAAQFARCGCDVSVQYGANQPEYDLLVARGERLLKISVKGSQDGSWGLAQSELKKFGNANYQGAIKIWLEKHGSRTVICS